MGKLSSILILLRPKQWVKNFFVFAALFFSGNITNTKMLESVGIAFIIFCFTSSCIYTLNDIVDIENDKVHPEKRKRPLASEKIKVSEAIVIGMFLAITSITLSVLLSLDVTIIILLYFFNNIAYSFFIKNMVILDVFSIAIGFLLRVIAGAVVIDVKISSWLLLCTFFVSLFLALGKRKGEIKLLKDKKSNHRKILNDYSNNFLNTLINLVLSCTIVFYSVYTVIGSDKTNMVYTTVFVLYGVFRYLFIIENTSISNDPTTVLFKDKHILITVVIWIISCFLVVKF